MLIRKLVFAGLACLAFANSYANIRIDNHTGYYGTAKMDFTPCSSISSSGVLKPYSSIDVPKAAVDAFCGLFDCTVNLYLGPNCNGKPIGVAKVNARRGITSVRTFTTSQVVISGHGNYGSIDPR